MPPAIHRDDQATDDNINRAVPAIWPPQTRRDMVIEMLTSDDGPFNETQTESTKLRTEVLCRHHAVK
jgi:hypothetical protein